MQDHATAPPLPSGRRVNGLVLLALLVFGGLGITSAYYRWKAAEIIAQRKRELASAPTETAPRVERWLEFGRTYVHQRLLQLRISASLPWLVTHAVLAAEPNMAPELWGVDLSGLEPGWSRRDGNDVVVDLPPAQILGRAWLPEDKALFVPKIAAGAPAPDAALSAERARAIAEHALEPLVKALPRDIPGARLVVHVGGRGESR